MEQGSWHEGGGRSEMGGPAAPPEGPSLPGSCVDSHGWIRTWSRASHPASSEEGPPSARGPRRRRSTPRGSGGLFLSRVTSGTEDFLTEGTLYNTRRRPQRAGPCGTAAQGTPRGADQGVVPPSFLRLPGVLGFTLCASPPRLGRPVAWREVSPKGPNRRFRPSQLPPITAGRRGGGGGATGRTPRAFSLQKSGTDPQKSEFIRGSG